MMKVVSESAATGHLETFAVLNSAAKNRRSDARCRRDVLHVIVPLSTAAANFAGLMIEFAPFLRASR